MNLTKKLLVAAFLAVALTLSLATAAWSQSAGSGTIQGRVTDQSGAVIPGAQVTIRSASIGFSRSLQTNESGEYRAVLLPPAEYEVLVEAKGFGAIKRTGVRVEVGSTATVSVELQVATAAETVTVTAEAPITEPERQEVTSVVTEKQVEELPINVRRWDNFALLAPAAIPDGTFGLISTRGISGLLNNNTVDGADNNQAFFGEARGRTRVTSTYSQAAIKEFQVGVSNFSAEFGRAAGGTINAVTKSGTNAWHGEVFYNIRDDSLQAREPTLRDNRTNDVLKNKDRRQQYGLATGMPVIPDKVFFFGSFEQHYRNESYLATGSAGNFFTTFDSVCRGSTPSAQLITNCDALRDYMFEEAGQHPRKIINSLAFGKVDWQMNPNNRLTGSYNWHRWKSPNGIQTQQTLSRGASDNGFDGVKTDSLVIRMNSVISSNKVNEASFQFGRDFEFQTANSTEPRTTITGGVSFGMSEFLPRPAWPDEKRYQWTDNFSWMVSNHTLKMGFDINYVRVKTINIRNGGGVYDYTSLTGLAQDCPTGARALGCVPITTGAASDFKHWNFYTQAFDLRGQDGRLFFTTTDYNAYIQDTWKIHPTVTLNMGLRYEYQRFPNVEPSDIGGTSILGYPGIPESQSLNADTNNFGPRVSVAWDIGGRQKNILRVGGGIYYGRTPNAILRSHLLENGVALPSFGLSGTSSSQQAAGPQYPNILATPPTAAGGRNVAFLAGDYVQAFIMMMDVAYEREITRNISVSTTYLYTRGSHLIRSSDINLNPPTTTASVLLDADGLSATTTDRTVIATGIPFYAGLRPMVDVLVAAPSCDVPNPAPSCTRLRRVLRQTSDLNSRYNAFILQLTQRARFGLTQTAHFTISLAEDEGQAMGASPFAGSFETLFDPQNRRAEFSRSDFDVRKRFVWSFIWEPSRVWSIDNPAARHVFGDWSFSGIVTVHDGQPFSPTISGSIGGGPSSTTGLCATSGTTGTCASETGSINGSGGSLRLGWLERNFLETTGFANVDFRVSKDVRVGEQMKIRFLAEAFNLFNRNNHPNRFNFSTTALRVGVLTSTGSTTSTGNTVGGPPSNLNVPREIILRQDNSFAPVVGLDLVNGTGDLSLCTVDNCLRSASGKLFQQRDIQIGVKFIW